MGAPAFFEASVWKREAGPEEGERRPRVRRRGGREKREMVAISVFGLGWNRRRTGGDGAGGLGFLLCFRLEDNEML